MIDEIEAKFKNEKVGISYVYIDYADQDQQTAMSITSSLLKQLAACLPNEELPSSIFELYTTLRPKGRKPDLSQLVLSLLAVAREFQLAFIILDALDECVESELSRILKVLKELSSESFKIFITSRPHLSLCDGVFQCPRLQIVADTVDVRRYLTERVSGKMPSRHELNEVIIDTLAPQAKGVYFLAI